MPFDIPLIGNVNIGQILMNYSTPMLALIGALLIVVAVFVVLDLKKKGVFFTDYPVKVRIWEQYAHSFKKAKDDKARAFQEDGKWFYQLKSSQAVIQPIPFEFINEDNSLDLIAMNRDEYHPFKLMSGEAIIRGTDGVETIISVPMLKPVIDETFKHVWTERTRKNIEKKYESSSLIDKYLPVAAPIIVVVFTTALLYVALHEVQPVFEAAASVGASMATYAHNCSLPIAVGVAP